MPDVYYRAAPEYRRAEARRAFWTSFIRWNLSLSPGWFWVLYECISALMR